MKDNLLFILLLTSIASCNTKSEISKSENSKNLFPLLLIDNQISWDTNRSIYKALISREPHYLTFKLSNHHEFSDSILNINYLKRINTIDFKIIYDDKASLNYTPKVNDSIGSLLIDFSLFEKDTIEYQIEMNLEFSKSDSTFKYYGQILLE